MPIRGLGIVVAGALAVAGVIAPALTSQAAADPSCPWVGSTAPIEQRVQQVLAQMTLDDKIAMVHGVGGPYVGNVAANPRLCIPALTLEDGPAGVADGMTGVTQLPAPVAVAASWDPSTAQQYGAVVGNEEAGKGANVDLGPTVNIVRDPRWGRAFESYSEDPYLAGQIGAADIQGVQSQGVMAQVKHWAVYNQETNRNTVNDNALIDDKALHEIYTPAFQTAVQQGQASSAMCSYSTINGTYACEDPQIDSIIKDVFGLAGFITSDWGATHSTVASANAGMDMEMPGSTYFGSALKQAVLAGKVAQSRLDDMVTRILREEFRFGLFDKAPSGSPSAVVTSAAHAAAARSVAEDGTVLLKNAGNVLPLGDATHSIAVIGNDAGADAQSAGGGSAAVNAPYVVTPFDGIKSRAGQGVDVQYAQGSIGTDGQLPAIPAQYLTPPSGTGTGLQGDYYSNATLSGSPTTTQTDQQVSFTWNGSPAPGVPSTNFSTKWTGTLTPPQTGTYTFALTSDDGSRLFINGQQVIDNWGDHGPATKSAQIALTAGTPVQVEVDYYQAGGGAMVNLGWQLPGIDLQQQAVNLAAKSDVAVVFASDFESEGSDLSGIDLPGQQNALISAVAAANPHTIVVLNTGSAVTMPWIDQVAGVFEAWYPGQEDGSAIAALLFGDTNPSGKLPVTFPTSLAQVPAATTQQWPGVNGQVHYSEGVDVGYRWYDARNLTPLFPFGYGLSYTSFAFSNLTVGAPTLDANGTLTVGATVTNTGQRAGSDVAQLYLTLPAVAGDPPRQLKGFQKVELQPGESQHVTFQLRAADASYWDAGAGGWTLAASHYSVSVGDSSRSLPLTGGFDVTSTVGPRTTTLQAPPVLIPGGTATATTTFTNGSTQPAAGVTNTVTLPAGWTATPTTPAHFGIVGPGDSVTTTWAVTGNSSAGTFPASATTTYAGGQSVSTPTTVSVPFPAFASAYDTVGVSDDSNPAAGNFDGGGYSFSAQALAAVGITPGSTVGGFTWPNVPAGQPDAVTSGGQLVEFTGSGSTLSFLGAGGFGTQQGTVTVTYTDGTTSSGTITMADWYANQAVAGCTLVATTSHWNIPPGSTLPPDHDVSLYASSVPLTAGKSIAYVKLPANSNLHFFATAVS